MRNPISKGLLYSAMVFGVGTAVCNEVADHPVNQDSVLAEAKRLSAAPYVQVGALPAGLDRLNAEQYRDIQYPPDAAIWKDNRFSVQLLPGGFYFQVPLGITLIEGDVAHDVVSKPGMFQLGPAAPPQLANLALPLSGFGLWTHLESPTNLQEFARFQGASYFRARGKGQIYGLSARGLALNIAEPPGEEYPAFRRFWIERPEAEASSIVVYALLDSPSVTGAYQFKITTGAETAMDVEVTLFPRAPLHSVGIAPLTSMFLYDESKRGGRDDYRPEVHDSDGLEITSASGELIWRQLSNPSKLQVSSFTSEAPRGFGLVQRSRSQDDFQDMDAHYEKRPSAWVEPTSDWGEGSVELVEIPSTRETNENITAFWHPTGVINPGAPWHGSYRMTWNAQPKVPRSIGRAVSTLSGAAGDNRRLFLVDLVGAGERTEGLRVDLAASAGKLSNVTLVPNVAIRGMRVGFELNPNNADVVELRLRVLRNNRPISETWLYRWTAT